MKTKKNSSSKKSTVEIDSLLTLLQDINFNLLEIKKDLAELIVINNYPKQEPLNFGITGTKPEFYPTTYPQPFIFPGTIICSGNTKGPDGVLFFADNKDWAYVSGVVDWSHPKCVKNTLPHYTPNIIPTQKFPSKL